MINEETLRAAKAFEEEILETVDVNLKMPKLLVDFLKAVIEFTRLEMTVEEMCCDTIIRNTVELLRANTLDEIFAGFEGAELIKAYKLDKLDC